MRLKSILPAGLMLFALGSCGLFEDAVDEVEDTVDKLATVEFTTTIEKEAALLSTSEEKVAIVLKSDNVKGVDAMIPFGGSVVLNLKDDKDIGKIINEIKDFKVKSSLAHFVFSGLKAGKEYQMTDVKVTIAGTGVDFSLTSWDEPEDGLLMSVSEEMNVPINIQEMNKFAQGWLISGFNTVTITISGKSNFDMAQYAGKYKIALENVISYKPFK